MLAKSLSLLKLFNSFGRYSLQIPFLWLSGSVVQQPEKLQQVTMKRICFRHVTGVSGIFEYDLFDISHFPAQEIRIFYWNNLIIASPQGNSSRSMASALGNAPGLIMGSLGDSPPTPLAIAYGPMASALGNTP